MNYCNYCGHKINDNDNFCPNCGIKLKEIDHFTREILFQGSYRKCPSCGEPIESFTGLCPACGYEFTEVEQNSEIQKFKEKIAECDEAIASENKERKKSFREWPIELKFLWIIINVFCLFVPFLMNIVLKPVFTKYIRFNLTAEEKKKSQLILNESFSYTRKSLVDQMLFIQSKLNSVFENNNSIGIFYWAKLWKKRSVEITNKAKIIIPNDKTINEIKKTIDDKYAELKKSVLKESLIRIVVSLCIIVAGAFGILKLYGGNLNQSNKKNYEWPTSGLAVKIPEPSNKSGEIEENKYDSFKIKLEGVSEKEYKNYIQECINFGYNGTIINNNLGFYAYDKNKTLRLNISSLNRDGEVSISLRKLVSFSWPSSGLLEGLPKPTTYVGEIEKNDDSVRIILYGESRAHYNEYIDVCKKSDFSVVKKTDSYISEYKYQAFDKQKTRLLTVEYYSDYEEIHIEIETPMEMDKIEWPSYGPVEYIPKPKKLYGSINKNSSTELLVYIGNTSMTDYREYIESCKEMGFSKDFETYDTSFEAEIDGCKLTVKYEDFDIMRIYVKLNNK